MRWRGLEVVVATATLGAAFAVTFARMATEPPEGFGGMIYERMSPREPEPFVGPPEPAPCFMLDDRALGGDDDTLALRWPVARDARVVSSEPCVVAPPTGGPHGRQAPWRSHGYYDNGATATRWRGTSAYRRSSPGHR